MFTDALVTKVELYLPLFQWGFQDFRPVFVEHKHGVIGFAGEHCLSAWNNRPENTCIRRTDLRIATSEQLHPSFVLEIATSNKPI